MQYTAILLIVLFALGCVGPMTPFGATSSFGPKPATEMTAPKATWMDKRRARVRFSPDRQVLHGPSPIRVIIEDPEGVPEDFHLQISYNGVDVTQSFLAQAETLVQDPLRHELRLTAKNLRLPSDRDNQIKVIYWRDREAGGMVTSQYLPPVCSAYASNQMLLTLPDFAAPLSTIQLINQHAFRKHLNPYFVAALVAQESGFDATAISRNRAMGLTQVTPLGESEVIKRFASWPRYPGASEMSFPVLKLSVLGGQIHAGNEWRLDPALSIQGGVEYLSYLSEYWQRPDKRAHLERKLGPSETALSEVILASYNSGASRVYDALEREGANYLQDLELMEANRYVRRVVSYCDYFAHQEE